MSIRSQRRYRLRAAQKRLLAEFDQMPKPAKLADGRCSCGCIIWPDHGACPLYQHAAHDRCAACDHSIQCHPRSHERRPQEYNTPLDKIVLRIRVPGRWERLWRWVKALFK